MALVSPGVEVTVIDESIYIPAATNSVPYILIATAQNKISGTGVGVAPGTLAANAGRVYLITSQRDLASTFGNPFFYKTSTGTPINGYELNEYGLLAAHSALGITNRAYVQRADIDLAELTATLVRPTGEPADGTYWLETDRTAWGIFQWNQITRAFSLQTPIVITDTAQIVGGLPSQDIGNIGDYAVDATNANNPVYFKTPGNIDAGVQPNSWVLVGTNDWQASWPSVQGTNSVTTNNLTVGNTITINTEIFTLATSSLSDLVDAINARSITGVTAAIDSSNRFVLFGDSIATGDGITVDTGIVIAGTSADLASKLGIADGSYAIPALQQSPSYTVPTWRTTDPRPTGSIWNVTTPVNQGASFAIRRFDSVLGIFVAQSAPLYASDQAANKAFDPSGGGRNIPVGTLYVQYNTQPETVDNNTLTFKIFERTVAGAVTITGDNSSPTFVIGDSFTMSYSTANSDALTAPVTVTMTGTTAVSFVTDVLAALPSGSPVTAAVTSSGAVSFTHRQGGVIVVNGDPITDAGITVNTEGARLDPLDNGLILSGWTRLVYLASANEPDQDPAAGRRWYYSAIDQVDIMINTGAQWVGYRNANPDIRGFDLTATDPNGPIISAAEPTEQSTGDPLVAGDLWIDTSNLEQYPILRRWEESNGVLQWVIIDNTDQSTENGVLFADARWAPNGTTNPITDNFPTIQSMLTSNYVDIDVPNATLYPAGMLLWNTRRSGFNVKSYQPNYFNANDFLFEGYSDATSYVVGDKVLYDGVIYVCTQDTTGNAPTNTTYWNQLETTTWLTVSGNRADGSPYMGRKAVRQLVVQAMKQVIDSQDVLREEQLGFNLLSAPQYPELMPNMVALNNERNNTGFVIGDTPLRLVPTGTELAAWATNQGGLGLDGEAGLLINDAYMGVFYPSCQTTDLGGSQVVQPPSHMMLRTIIRSDEVSYPWLAPAGIRRGLIDNAERIGYINPQTGEFNTISMGQGLRDVLYVNKINPITFFPGVGLVNYGNKSTSPIISALDRINVARLVAYLRGRLEEIGRQFVFEPNDQITRNEISNSITGLMIDLVAKRGVYDYLVVCDLTNNTPARIDRNELWVDVAIEPVKAAEFIYIPLRIKNTGEISGGQSAASGG